jgi:hypothetical protein
MDESEDQKQTYSDLLPRKVTGHTCQSLAPNGELCGKPAEFEVGVQGDPGMHEDAWVAVFLCKHHAEQIERQFWQ